MHRPSTSTNGNSLNRLGSSQSPGPLLLLLPGQFREVAYSTDGRVPIQAVNEALDSGFESEDFDTIGGSSSVTWAALPRSGTRFASMAMCCACRRWTVPALSTSPYGRTKRVESLLLVEVRGVASCRRIYLRTRRSGRAFLRELRYSRLVDALLGHPERIHRPYQLAQRRRVGAVSPVIGVLVRARIRAADKQPFARRRLYCCHTAAIAAPGHSFWAKHVAVYRMPPHFPSNTVSGCRLCVCRRDLSCNRTWLPKGSNVATARPKILSNVLTTRLCGYPARAGVPRRFVRFPATALAGYAR